MAPLLHTVVFRCNRQAFTGYIERRKTKRVRMHSHEVSNVVAEGKSKFNANPGTTIGKQGHMKDIMKRGKRSQGKNVSCHGHTEH